MKIRIFYPLLALLTIFTSACNKNDEPLPTSTEKATSILLYAVASNNLAYYFQEDLSELKAGLKSCNLSEVDFYVYSVAHSKDEVATLSKAVITPTGSVEFETIKEYDRATSSTDPERISEVIEDYKNQGESSTRGMILWSHSTAWSPSPESSRAFMASDSRSNSALGQDPESKGAIGDLVSFDPTISEWWGQDINNGVYNYCNLTDLATALPDEFFDFIWFDCCYMSSVEVIYELRNKADLFVAYPTEVNAEGAPYEIVTPLIARKNPDLIEASKAMSDYYESGNKVYTIAVIDPAAIEKVAECSAKVADAAPEASNKLVIYSRAGHYFYDFAQFMKSKGASSTAGWDEDEFDAALNKLIIYKNCGNRLFTGQALDKNNYSGISTGYIVNADAVASSSDSAMKYYQTLEWFKRVYAPSN